MEITWNGNSCFTIKGKNASLVINPHKDIRGLKGDIVLSGLDDELADVDGSTIMFDWPGEYETKSIPVNIYETKGKEEKPLLIFRFEIDDFTICHIGKIGEELSSDLLNEIGDVDILLTDSKQASEIVESIEPRIIIPMGENDPVNDLKAIGGDKIEKEDKLILKSASELPESEMRYIVLNSSR